MMYEYVVEVSIRKGLGPEWVRKDFPVAFDDIEEWVPESDVKAMAIREIEIKTV